MFSAFSDLGTSLAGKDIFMFNNPWCSLRDPCSAVSFQTSPSHYKTKAKDVYKLLLMVKNIAMLNQFTGVITTFFILSIFFSPLCSPIFKKPEGAK